MKNIKFRLQRNVGSPFILLRDKTIPLIDNNLWEDIRSPLDPFSYKVAYVINYNLTLTL